MKMGFWAYSFVVILNLKNLAALAVYFPMDPTPRIPMDLSITKADLEKRKISK